MKREVGIIQNKGNAIEQVRKIREKLSEEPIDFEEINNFGKL